MTLIGRNLQTVLACVGRSTTAGLCSFGLRLGTSNRPFALVLHIMLSRTIDTFLGQSPSSTQREI